MTDNEGNAIDVPIPWSAKPLHVTGTLAIGLIIYLATAWYFRDLINTGNLQRAAEHNELICNQEMEIFIHQFPRGEVDWALLPGTLYHCLPEYTRAKGNTQKR